MAYRKLSEQVQQLSNPQRSDTFVKRFREAVRAGEIEAAYVPERFELPKAYRRRDEGDTYRRGGRDMVFVLTPAFERWFEGVNRELAPARQGGRVAVSAESIEAGLIDFKALAAETRQKMEVKFTKGQALGRSRAERPRAAAVLKSRGRPRKTA